VGAEGLVVFEDEGEDEELGGDVFAPVGPEGWFDCELDEFFLLPGVVFDVGDVVLDCPGLVPGVVDDCVGPPGVVGELDDDGIEFVGEVGDELEGAVVDGEEVEGEGDDGAEPDVAAPPDAPDPPADWARTAAAPKVVRAVATTM
jgi:hypothetical protein